MGRQQFDEPYKLFQIVLPDSLYSALKREASERGVTMAFLIRSALEKELKRREEVSE